MSDTQFKNLLKTEMTRKEFLWVCVVAIGSIVGIAGLIRELLSHAATPSASSEAESTSGTVTAPATTVTSSTASGGKAVQFGTGGPSNNGVLMGMYNGNPNESPDATFVSLFGKVPELASTYLTSQAINQTYEKARLAAGTNIIFDLDPKNTPGLLYEIATKTTTGMNYINTFLQDAEKVAISASNGAKVYVSLAHEWEVKQKAGRWTDPNDANWSNYAKAHSIFNQQAASLAPHVLPGFWTGGYSTNQTTLANIMAAMTTPCKWVSCDPYKTSGTQTLLQNWNGYGVDFFQANATYKAWGSPPLFITEYGVNTDGFTDSALATYLAGIRDTMRSAGVAGCIYFNRDRADESPTHMWKLDNGDTPLALAAFKNSFLAS